MSKIITFKGKLNIGTEEKINLSTNNGLTGYRISKFEIISSTPHAADVALVAKVRLTSDPNIGPAVDFSDTDLMAVNTYEDKASSNYPTHETIIFDRETFNQDVFVTMADADSNTTPANYYLELETFKLDLNESTYHTIKNIRSATQA